MTARSLRRGGRQTVTLDITYHGYKTYQHKIVTVPLDMLLEAEIAYPSEPVPTYPQTDGYIKNRKNKPQNSEIQHETTP